MLKTLGSIESVARFEEGRVGVAGNDKSERSSRYKVDVGEVKDDEVEKNDQKGLSPKKRN